jgi:hypothetical protein
MLRARRLKQIAESNKPVFSSTETEWWLAEAPVKSQTKPCNIPDNSAKAPELKKEIPPASNSSAQDAAADEPAAVHANSNHEFLFLKESASRAATEMTKKEEMTWDAKMACFVMS